MYGGVHRCISYISTPQLNDVDLGGSTVFPYLNLRVAAQKVLALSLYEKMACTFNP